MRNRHMGAVALLAAMGSACGSESVNDAVRASEPSPATLSLPCDESEQTLVMWDVPGPGQPTPSQAVAPHAGALTLVEQESARDTTVFGLRDDGSVLRAFEVTKHDDGWWPDGYRECSG
jgi:hypothetical protein